MTESFVGTVIQVHMRYFKSLRVERCRIDGKSVILRRDFYSLSEKILDGMVSATMSELQLERLGIERKRKQLDRKSVV